MSKILRIIYCQSINVVIICIAISVLLWGVISYIVTYKNKKDKVWKLLNVFLSITSIMTIIYSTILLRQNQITNIQLIPFNSFIEAKQQPEIYRSMLMNFFLFLPLGLTLPFSLPDRLNRKVLVTVLLGMFLSIIAESLQYIFHLGRAETDDVICNTLGTAFGTLSYIVAKYIRGRTS